MYRLMLTARAVDERALVLVRQGKTQFTVGGQGHEAAQVGAAWTLRPGVDWVLPYYRDTALVLTLGISTYEIFLGEFAKADDPGSGGRQMPRHWSYPRLRIITASSVVATQLPHAVGCALAARLAGEDAVAFVSFGDGAVSKGDFHEALSFAGIHRLPVVFFCENNYYAISVPFSQQSPVASVADRASAYGFPGVSVDGNDPLAVYEVTRKAVQRARQGQGPTLIEARTYRLGPHTSNDDDRRYRSRAEVEEWHAKDPLRRFGDYLISNGLLSETEAQEWQKQTHDEVAEAANRASMAPELTPDVACRFVYAEEDGR
ncbi:MAG: thiamine pyrophosphate-dependent dehydrogenase E1 component subunit alpha [Firmicutes bacterium]|jgi:2-oxoisovalerate dehydrogenase E1 component alpha subunit|nr:thiamine pyrophosphate-dependent dehydrogenase E1 component subunit alpha [Bacillota bacterium]